MHVTVGIPFFNNHATLAFAIRSVLAQSYQDWTLLLVDDGSRDGSLAIAREYRDPRICVISDGVNRGLPVRLNQIATLAKGKYVARMDADDLMHPERLQKQVAYLEDHPSVDLLGTASIVMDSHYRVLGIRGYPLGDTSAQAILRRAPVMHPTVMGRADWLRRHPYNPEFRRVQDRELWCRTFRETLFAVLPEPLYYYREEPSTLVKYWQACRYERRILRAYGPQAIGTSATCRLLLENYCKAMVHVLAAIVGARGLIYRRRNSSLPEEDRMTASREMHAIMNPDLAGVMSER